MKFSGHLFTVFCIAALQCPVLLSCSRLEPEPKPEPVTPSGPSYTLSISSKEAKTAITPSSSGTYLSSWNADDKLQIYIDELSSSSGSKYTLVNNVEGRTATFMGNVGSNEGAHTIYGFYPAEALVSGTDTYDGDFILSADIPWRQTPSAGGIDPLCDLLCAAPMDVNFGQSSQVEISTARFARMLSIVKLVPVDNTTGGVLSSDYVNLVKMTSSDKILSGRARLDIENAEITSWTSQSSYKFVQAGYSKSTTYLIDGVNASYLMVAPGTLAAGQTLDFEVATGSHLLRKSVTLPSNVNLTAGAVTVLKVKMDDACIVECGDPLPFNEDFEALVNGDNVSTTGSNTSWKGNANFPSVSNTYEAGKAVRAGTSKNVGYIQTKPLNLSCPFTVTFKVKGWSSAGSVQITVGSQTKSVSYSSGMTGAWETKSVSFFAESAVSSVVLSTVSESKRCFIDDVSITEGKEDEHEILVSAQQVNLAAQAASTDSFTIIADNAWTLSSTEGSSGFTFSPSSGDAAQLVEVTVTATSANKGTSSKLLGAVRVSDGTVSKLVSVYQSAPSGPLSSGWAELPSPTTGDNLELCKHDKLPSNSSIRNYSFLFDKTRHCSLWVAWPLHSCYLGDADRTNAFGYDPSFIVNDFEANIGNNAYYPQGGQSYSHSRGHQMPSADRTASLEDNYTTFYATNMTPQLQTFNGGVWVQLEERERSTYMCSDTLYIVSGPYFDPDESPTYAYDNKGKGKACQVPTHYWKIFLRTKAGNSGKNVSECSAAELQCVGFWFSHSRGSGQPLVSDLRTVKQIEDLTGFTFFPNVPNAPKTTYTASDWGM